MPKLIHRNPAYSKHKASGQAVVTLNGKDHYLGTHGTKASRAEYDRLIALWLAGGRRMPTDPAGDGPAVVEVMNAYWRHVQTYYRRADGTHTSEVDTIRQALRPLKNLFGPTPASKFGPQALKALRQAMVDGDPTPRQDGKPTRRPWCRTFVNKQISRVRGMFRWAVEQEMIEPGVYQALAAVAGLKKGRSEVRESDPVTPVADEHVNAVLDRVSPQFAAMIRLQLLTGMRPGEVVAMRTRDLDTAGKLWTYRPATHKTEHHGFARVVYLGKNAIEILKPFIKPDLSAHLFSPADAEAVRLAKLHATRKTPHSHGNRPGTNRVARPRRKPGDCYDVPAYRRAITRACAKAEIPPWHPHQLRHTAATRLRRDYGLEAAQVILGHQTLTVTQVYARKNIDAVMKIMGEVG